MPIYEYRCDDCGTSFEVMQKMSDEPLEACEACGGHLRKVLHPVAIHFKGSGFYTTDYGKASGRRADGAGDEASGAGDTTSSGAASGGEAAGKDAAGGSPGDAQAAKPAKAGGKAKEKQKAT